MKKVLVRGFMLIMLAALLVSGTLNALAFNSKLTSEARNDLRDLASAIAPMLDISGNIDAQTKEYSSSISGKRVTVIAPDGVVVGDSEADYAAMRNHLDAPEIAQASLSGFGTSIRNSQTIGTKLVYAAVRTADGYFVRVSGEVSGVVSTLLSVVPVMMIALILALLLSIFTANRFSGQVLKPIFKMNESLLFVKDGGVILDTGRYRYDELVSLAGKINVISMDLSEHIQSLKQEKDKLNYILDNVQEGFMLLDEKQNILLINSTACTYLKCTKEVVGESIYRATRDPDILRLSSKVLRTGLSENLDIESDGRIIEIIIFRTTENSGFSAAVIATMKDVTDIRSAAKIKRDFFSDASHELKTPITSIKGCAELLCSDLDISDAQKGELLARIGTESERMNSLINDIILINRMESGNFGEDREPVEVFPLISECMEEIRPMSDRDGVSISFSGLPVTIYADPKDLRAMISNLLVNAVKYNKRGGAVDITLKSDGREAVLSVRNDGDPIPAAQLPRIFDRFYRVDSGRSRTVGGTGLGLAIVKHAADSMGGSVSVSSDEQNGTLFTVHMPI